MSQLVFETLSTSASVTCATPDATLDITADVCPMTFVRTRLALDRLLPGQVLCIHLRGEEPRQNVPRSALELGHTLLAEHTDDAGITTFWLRKQAHPAR